jgi:hypothetical protein
VVAEILGVTPVDRVVKGKALKFRATNVLNVEFPAINGKQVSEPMHVNAIKQAASRVEIPTAYVDKLQSRGEWGQQLLAHNLNEQFSHLNGDKFLTRSTHGVVKGFLSDSYRRMDSRPILDSFIAACDAVGALPYMGYNLESKMAIQAILPMVFEPVPGEVIAFGVYLGNSDFGDGALSLRGFFERMWCENGAIMEEILRKIHLGKRLSEDISFLSTDVRTGQPDDGQHGERPRRPDAERRRRHRHRTTHPGQRSRVS